MTEVELLDYARLMIEQQGDEARPHLAEAIVTLRSIGDLKGARLLSAIARRVDQLEGFSLPTRARRRAR